MAADVVAIIPEPQKESRACSGIASYRHSYCRFFEPCDDHEPTTAMTAAQPKRIWVAVAADGLRAL